MEKHQPYKSCGCRACRSAPSKVKGFEKRLGHRKYRHDWRAAISHNRTDDEAPVYSGGYKD